MKLWVSVKLSLAIAGSAGSVPLPLIQLLDMQGLIANFIEVDFSDRVASRMRMKTRGLSHHKAKPSRQSSPATLSFTKYSLLKPAYNLEPKILGFA